MANVIMMNKKMKITIVADVCFDLPTDQIKSHNDVMNKWML